MFEQNPLMGPGTSNFTSHLLEIILMLAVAALLGYLLGRLIANSKWRAAVDGIQGKLDLANNQVHQLEVDVRQHLHRVQFVEGDLKDSNNKQVFLQEDVKYWKNKANQLEISYQDLSTQINSLQASINPNPGVIETSVSEKIISDDNPENNNTATLDDAQDAITDVDDMDQTNAESERDLARDLGQHDLTRIEGIGPKINDLLQSKGINTFDQLASTDLSQLIDIISPLEGSEMHDPSSWIKQAKLAAENNFEGLDEYQAFLVGGRDPAINDALDASSGFFGNRVVYNDLQLIEGIGPKIEELFNSNGIYTWAKLAGTSVTRCREILEYGGDNYAMHDPATWPEQAALAASLDWAGLKKLQEDLQGGLNSKW